MGIYIHGEGRGSMHGKLLRGNTKGKWRFWLNRLNIILADSSPGRSDITWGIVGDEEFDQILRANRYEG